MIDMIGVMITRRDFVKLAAGTLAVPAFANIDSKFDGVMIGAQTYSFRTLPSLDACIAAMKEIGLGYAELWDNQILPKDRSKISAWRSNPPMDEIRGIRKKFDDAGIDLYAFNYSFRDEFTDEQIEQGFLMAKAMGVTRITASANVDISPRVDKYARAIQDLCRLSRPRQHEAERVFHSGRLEAARWPAVRSTPASTSTSATSPPPASIRSVS